MINSSDGFYPKTSHVTTQENQSSHHPC